MTIGGDREKQLQRQREWQQRSREKAAERAREKPRTPLAQGAGPSRKPKRTPSPSKRKRDAHRAAERFARNFGSTAYVLATKAERCVLCRGRDRVVTGHILEARGMGGAGGDVTTTAPICTPCDDSWGQGSGPSPTRLRILERHGMTWNDLVQRVREHHERYGHLYAYPTGGGAP